MKKHLITAFIALAFSTGVSAAETKKESSAVPSKETRESMAMTYEKMAQCLRSEEPIQDCHQKMREQCQGVKDEGGCFMMEHNGKGMMRGHRNSAYPPKGK